MDKPVINLRAWEPLEKRKKKAEARQKLKSEQMDKKNIVRNEDIDGKSLNSSYNSQDKYAKNRMDELRIESKKTAPNYYEYKFNSDQIEQPTYKADKSINKTEKSKYNIEIIEKINKKYKKNKNRHSFFSFNRSNGSNGSNRSNLVKFIIAGIGAIFTGIVFGYILLHYFVQPIFTEEPGNINSQNGSSISLNNTNQSTTSQMFYPAETIYLIQAGAFTEVAGAETIVAEQKQLGRAAVVSGTGPYYVYIGMGSTKGEAVQIKNMLDQENELYVKEYILPEYNLSTGTEQDFDSIYNFLSAGDKLTELLSQGTSLALANANYSFNYDEIEKAHQELLLELQNVKQKPNNENYIKQQEIIENLNTDLYYAVTALNAYKKNPNIQYLWSIQELLIKYKLKYEELAKI